MPNGHGGIPFLGAPLLLALGFVVGAWWRLDVPSTAHSVRVALCLGLAAAAGWRLAYHLSMRHADEYGGAYYSADERAAALGRYRPRAVLYAVLACAAGAGVLWMRGAM